LVLADVARQVRHTGLAGRVVRLPLSLVPHNLTFRILTGINRGMHWITGTGPNRGCWIGTYEADRISALPKVVRPGTIAYDIGANAGFYTLALSRLVGDSGRVFSFEPEAGNVYALRRHIELNQLRNVTIVQTAVSNRAGMVGFDASINPASGKITQERDYLIPSISLDEFIATGNPAPAFIKMDIEGAETQALAGAKHLLSTAQPIWMMATHGPELCSTCRDILSSNRYQFKDFGCVNEQVELGDFMAFPSPA
jgi:FkbM family methyltransferase